MAPPTVLEKQIHINLRIFLTTVTSAKWNRVWKSNPPHKEEGGEHGEGDGGKDALECAEGAAAVVPSIGKQAGPLGGPAQGSKEGLLTLHQLRHVLCATPVPEPDTRNAYQITVFPCNVPVPYANQWYGSKSCSLIWIHLRGNSWIRIPYKTIPVHTRTLAKFVGYIASVVMNTYLYLKKVVKNQCF